MLVNSVCVPHPPSFNQIATHTAGQGELSESDQLDQLAPMRNCAEVET